MNNKAQKKNILSLTQTAILAAVVFLLGFTPIGYLRVGIIEITFITIPVAVGAILLGPSSGAVLGLVFGITSFIQCFTGSLFGAALLSISPFFTIIMCIIPRVLMGWLTAFIFSFLYKKTNNNAISCGISSLSAALLNTLFFISSLLLLFGSTEYIQNMMTETFHTDNFLKFAVLFVGINGLVEAVACAVIGFAVSAAIIRFKK